MPSRGGQRTCRPQRRASGRPLPALGQMPGRLGRASPAPAAVLRCRTPVAPGLLPKPNDPVRQNTHTCRGCSPPNDLVRQHTHACQPGLQTAMEQGEQMPPQPRRSAATPSTGCAWAAPGQTILCVSTRTHACLTHRRPRNRVRRCPSQPPPQCCGAKCPEGGNVLCLG